ncbi:MAG: helix-turn-helix transcriptional regulator [Chloroflexota bacterium]
MDDYLPLSAQVKILFSAVRRADGTAFTLQEVSTATGISLGTIAQIRSGQNPNPQLNTLRALGQFFHVPLRYFETQSTDECYALLAQPALPKEPALNEIAFRASGLPPEAQQDILLLIKVFQEEDKQRRQAANPSEDVGKDVHGNDG